MIREAAASKGWTVSQFARTTLLGAARDALAWSQPLQVAPELARAILASLDPPDARDDV